VYLWPGPDSEHVKFCNSMFNGICMGIGHVSKFLGCPTPFRWGGWVTSKTNCLVMVGHHAKFTAGAVEHRDRKYGKFWGAGAPLHDMGWV